MTTYPIRIQQHLKGDVGKETISIRQTGGKVGKDVWIVEGVEPLVSGRSYVLAITNDRGGFTLLAGPHSSETVPDGAARSSVLSTWQDAVQNQRWPEHLPR